MRPTHDRARPWLWATALLLAVAVSGAWARTVECLGVTSGGVIAGPSCQGSISRDGRYVSLWSYSILAPPRTIFKANVYLRDRQLGTTELISVSPDGTQSGDGHSFSTVAGGVSDDGRYVAFRSAATNLVAGTHAHYQIYVRDRALHTTVEASVSNEGVEGSKDSSEGRITPDGRYVVYYTSSYNIAPEGSGVMLRDLVNNTTEYVSRAYDGSGASSGAGEAAMDATATYIAFESSSTNLVASDTNGVSDIFLRNRQTGTTTRISVSGSGGQADGASYTPYVSADGRYVTFESLATNLVTGDTNGVRDIFVWDRTTGQVRRVSVSSAGAEANGASYVPRLTPDGGAIVFYSEATNLVAGDSNGFDDVFVHDLGTGQTLLVSTSATGEQANADCQMPCASECASVVVFDSMATNLVAGAGSDLNIFAVLDAPLAVHWPR